MRQYRWPEQPEFENCLIAALLRPIFTVGLVFSICLNATMHHKPIQHCRQCGSTVAYRIPDDGDTRQRAICTSCHTIHYENPLNVVGTLPFWGKEGEQVLLCKRNIQPRKGFWTLPAGFMELGESTSQGAMRETDEEAGADIELQGLFTVMNVTRVGQVHFYYRAKLLSTVFNPGHETMEARLFTESEIPWDELAFQTVKLTLKQYFSDRLRNQYGIHTIDVA